MGSWGDDSVKCLSAQALGLGLAHLQKIDMVASTYHPSNWEVEEWIPGAHGPESPAELTSSRLN